MSPLSFWNFQQKALHRKMIAILEANGVTHAEAEGWAAKTLSQYEAFNNFNQDDLESKSYNLLQFTDLITVELNHLQSMMEGNYAKAREQIWFDFVKVQIEFALAAQYAKTRMSAFDQLGESQRLGLEVSGIGAKQWEILRMTEIVVLDGVEYLMPKKVNIKEVMNSYSTHLFRISIEAIEAI